MSENKVAKSKYSIVNKVLALFNAGDFGKTESFIGKVVRTLDKEVSTIERNIVNAKHNHTIDVEQFDANIEDAELALEQAFSDINPEKLGNNASQASLVEPYLRGISNAEKALDSLKEDLNTCNETHEKTLKRFRESIKLRKARINSIIN